VQGGDDHEIIMVNDGSTDTTGKILKTYSLNHKEMVLIERENGGPAAARNTGISVAKGEYLVFLDADDELLPDALHKFEQALSAHGEKNDYIYAGHYSVSASGKIKTIRPVPRRIDKRKAFARLIAGKGVSPTPGAITIRRNCFKKLSFPETIRCNEDFVLFAQLFALFTGKSIAEPVVYKYKRPGSLRSDKYAICDALNKAPNLLFDPSILPVEYLQFKSRYVAKRYLEKARSHFKDKEFKEFRKTYHQAIGAHVPVLFKPRFILRYIRSLIPVIAR